MKEIGLILWNRDYVGFVNNYINSVFPSVLIPLLFNVLLLFASCAGKNIDNDDKSVTVIDLFAESGSAISNLSEIASNIEYIPLQTTINSLLDGFPGKVIRTYKTIFIQNRSEIVCFSPTGKFLYKLQNKGRGPGEYTDIADFDASYDNKFLALISNLNHKLLIYQISDTGLIFHHSLTLKSPVPHRISLIQGTERIFLAIPPWEGSEPSLSLVINFSGDTISFRPNYYRYEPVRKINSRALKEYISDSEFENMQVDPLKKDEIRKIANTLNETDNPVLIVVTLKE